MLKATCLLQSMVSLLLFPIILLHPSSYHIEEHNLPAALMLCTDPHHHITCSSIRFSSAPIHALYSKETGPCFCHAQNFHQCTRLHEDGWIKGPHGQLLLWVPQNHRQPFYTPCTRLVIPRGCVELDLSRMAHGKNWQQCFQF